MMENNKFKYKIENKRYHTWNYYLRQKFGTKVFKVSINAGFTCPNIDGSISYGGCAYCSKDGSGDFAGNPRDNLVKQFKEIKEIMEKKWPQAKYIGYFQAFTNTYAPLEVLKEKYETILDQEGVIGLSISTRPDCIDDHILDYLDDLNKRTNLWVELGLQTVHDKTSNIINRGHGLDIFIDCVNRLRSRGIEVVAHVINGLPGESHDMMMETISRVAQMNIQGVKIHLLHVIKGTPMVNMLNRGDLKLLTKEEYVNLVCDRLKS